MIGTSPKTSVKTSVYLSFFILLSGMIFASGCAYFNTFYLARKNFNNGEYKRRSDKGVLNTEAKKSYNEAISWGTEVLDTYRTSRYVDDSLYIMGMSYYRLAQYVEARTKFNELMQAFPASEYVPSATLYKAKCLVRLGQNDEAREILLELMNSKDRSIVGDAALTLAEERYDQEDWNELLTSSKRVIDLNPDKEVLAKALYFQGEALYRLERYDECVEILQQVVNKKIDPELRFLVNSRIALSAAEQGDYDEAMSYLTEIENKGEFSDFAPRIRLDIGFIHEIQGDDEEAVSTYTKLAGDYPDSLAAREAWYRIGTITLKDLSKTDEAKKAFEMVKKGKAKSNASWVVEAELKSTQIDSLKAKVEAIDRIDKNDTDKLSRTRFSLAELYTFSFGRPDSALTQYRFITEEAPDTEFAIKSVYFINHHDLEQRGELTQESEEALMKTIIDEYPESEFAQNLKVYLGLIEHTPDEKAFLDADMARLNVQDPTVYMPLYQKVIDSFPDSKSAFKARFTMAYYYEHELGERDKAFELYKSLAAETPTVNSDTYVTLAKDKLAYAEQEERILKEKLQNIAYFDSILDGSHTVSETADDTGDKEAVTQTGAAGAGSAFTGLRKIRARNERIRSRYYTD